MSVYRCTAEAPWKPEYGTPVEHDSLTTLYTDDHHLDTADRKKCNNCGVEFWVEVPN